MYWETNLDYVLYLKKRMRMELLIVHINLIILKQEISVNIRVRILKENIVRLPIFIMIKDSKKMEVIVKKFSLIMKSIGLILVT